MMQPTLGSRMVKVKSSSKPPSKWRSCVIPRHDLPLSSVFVGLYIRTFSLPWNAFRNNAFSYTRNCSSLRNCYCNHHSTTTIEMLSLFTPVSHLRWICKEFWVTFQGEFLFSSSEVTGTRKAALRALCSFIYLFAGLRPYRARQSVGAHLLLRDQKDTCTKHCLYAAWLATVSIAVYAFDGLEFWYHFSPC